MNNDYSSHGSDVFDTNQCCECQPCSKKRTAVRRFASDMSGFPGSWLSQLTGDAPVPIWGTVFLVTDSSDYRSIQKLLLPIESEADSELEMLAAYDWQSVGSTGILALKFDDKLILAIQGAGYCFYEFHWEPLYDAIGHRWHK